MKKGIGLFLLSLALPAFAGNTGVLILRARVPASFEVIVDTNNKHSLPTIHSNGARITPKISQRLVNNLRIVSVVHP
jgi:hypothetical protein